MSPRVRYMLFEARYGWPLGPGLLVVISLLINESWTGAAIAAVITAVVTAAVYLKFDHPKMTAASMNK